MALPTFFLIDDDQDDRDIFRMAIEELNAKTNCLTFKSGAEALTHLRSGNIVPTHIFIDVNMPLMNGRECLMAIRQLDNLSGAKVYMYTTSSEIRERNDLINLGAHDIITKPAKISQLVSLLNEISVDR